MAKELKGLGLIAKIKLALNFRKACSMNITKAALIKAIMVGLGAVAAGYGVAFQDEIVTKAELINLGWLFVSAFLATLVHTDKPAKE
jgi:hypothetical protein